MKKKWTYDGDHVKFTAFVMKMILLDALLAEDCEDPDAILCDPERLRRSVTAWALL